MRLIVIEKKTFSSFFLKTIYNSIIHKNYALIKNRIKLVLTAKHHLHRFDRIVPAEFEPLHLLKVVTIVVLLVVQTGDGLRSACVVPVTSRTSELDRAVHVSQVVVLLVRTELHTSVGTQ